MPKGRGMVYWKLFSSIPEQFVGIRSIIMENAKVPRSIATQDVQERMETHLLTSLLTKEEILITYCQII